MWASVEKVRMPEKDGVNKTRNVLWSPGYKEWTVKSAVYMIILQNCNLDLFQQCDILTR